MRNLNSLTRWWRLNFFRRMHRWRKKHSHVHSPNAAATGHDCNASFYLSSRPMVDYSTFVSRLQCIHETGGYFREIVSENDSMWPNISSSALSPIKSNIYDVNKITTHSHTTYRRFGCIPIRNGTTNGFYDAMKMRVLFRNRMWAKSNRLFGLNRIMSLCATTK